MSLRVAVVGGGAGGAVAAITAAEAGAQVLLLERNHKPLKKLGVTGNGRCNLMNTGTPVYFGEETFAQEVLARVPASSQRAFWQKLGVPLREESEGRVYPAALQASVVTDALLLRLRQLSVQIVTDARVVALQRESDAFRIQAELSRVELDAKGRRRVVETRMQAFEADRVIIAVGGAAAPAHGTDGSSYGLLTSFGHALHAPRPALCALLTERKLVSSVSGQRVRARLTLLDAQARPLRESEGELLFGDDALSGIAAMQLARFVQPDCSLRVNLLPALNLPDEAALRALLSDVFAARRDLPAREQLTGLVTAPIARLLLPDAAVPSPEALAARMTDLRFPVTGTRGLEQAQVTAGGVSTEDFDSATMASRLCKGLYAVGEALDVDGDCGGFNLMFAFAGGMLAGRAAAK